MLLSLIICTYKRPQLLANCVNCGIQVLDKLNAEIIVVNDEKGAIVTVPSHPNISVYNNPKQGLASARNFGAKKSKGELLLFIDDDIEFNLKNIELLLSTYNLSQPACYNPNWKYSDEMLNTLRSKPFGRFLIHYGLINYKGWVPDIKWDTSVFEAHKLAGFFMLIPKFVFDSANGFNETFINQGTEDDEFCYRLQQQGIKMFVDPKNYVIHNEIDRISLENRLARYYNGATNRRKAFEMGHSSYKINYSLIKKILLYLLVPFYDLIIRISKVIPNNSKFDSLYFKTANVLLAMAIFKGYNKK